MKRKNLQYHETKSLNLNKLVIVLYIDIQRVKYKMKVKMTIEISYKINLKNWF